MNDGKLMVLVAQAVSLDREIAEQQEELKRLKAQLVAEAEGREDEQMPTEGGGWSVTFDGMDGCVARITKPGDALKAAIDGEGACIERVRELAGSHFSRLFLQAPKWKLVANFREEAAALLGKAAGKLIRAVTKASETKVAFETKEVQA
jgi:hypothetical protein